MSSEERQQFPYYVTDFLLTFLGCAFFMVDMGLDVYLVVSLYQEEAYVWMGVLLFFLLLSSVLLQIFSWLWYCYDEEKPTTKVDACIERSRLLKVCHVFQLGILLRYAGVLEVSIKSLRTKDYYSEGMAVYLTHDLSMLRLIDTFSESTPQLVLMISIIIHRQEFELFTCLKALGSAAAIALGVVMYHRSLRCFLPSKAKQGYVSSGVYFLWNLLLILARVATLALFASLLPWPALFHFVCLWVPLVIWAKLQKTDFMDSPFGEVLYQAVVGLIWYFSWFNVAKGRTRGRSMLYHGIMLTDVVFLMGLCWYAQLEQNLVLPLEPYQQLITAVFLYVVGLVVRIIYYKGFHPKKSDLEPETDMADEVDSKTEEVVVRCLSGRVSPRVNKRMKSHANNFYS